MVLNSPILAWFCNYSKLQTKFLFKTFGLYCLSVCVCMCTVCYVNQLELELQVIGLGTTYQCITQQQMLLTTESAF